MTRLLLALLVTLSLHAAPAAANGMGAGLPAQLRPAVTIEDDIIRLGDLWENLEAAKAETPVANAPQPGKSVTLEARWLAAVAQAYGIDWRPGSAFERVVLDRAGQTVDPRLIESEIRDALAMEGVAGNADIEISNRGALDLTLPAGQPATVAIRDLSWDARSHRFSAVVEAPAGAPNAIRTRVVGRVFATARVPVLNRLLNRGDVISARDIDWLEVRDTQMRADVITDPAHLVGQEPRWQVRQGVPVRASDVQRPVLVPRNSLVTLVLKTPYMTLTAQAKAIEDGGQGDVIRVTNLQTKRTIEGKVEGPGTVTVAMGGPLALAH